jgi:hypothetical protein
MTTILDSTTHPLGCLGTPSSSGHLHATRFCSQGVAEPPETGAKGRTVDIGLRRLCRAIAALSFIGFTFGSGGEAVAVDIAHSTVIKEPPVAYTPHIVADGTIPDPLALAIGRTNNTIYFGGKFHLVENAHRTRQFARNHIVAFNEATGAISTSFAPLMNNPVYAILGVGNAVYVGGEFMTVNGVPTRGLVKLDALTGAIDPFFNPQISGGRVSEIKLVNGRLIVGGKFLKKLVALNPTTGTYTNYINLPITGQLPFTTTPTEVYRFAVTPAGDRLVAVGNFTTVASENRKRAFMLTLGDTAASLNPWYYLPLDQKCAANASTRQNSLEDVDFSPDGSYFVFAATGFVPSSTADIGTAVCDAAARFETNDPAPVKPTWINYTGGDTMHSVVVTGAAVYVQGHFRWLNNPFGRDSAGPGAVNRTGIGAIDPVTGLALSWNPPSPARQGGQDFLVTETGLWPVSDALMFNSRYRRGMAFFPLP